RGRLADESGEAVGRRPEPRHPRSLVGAVDIGIAEDPPLAAIGAGEVEPRGADVRDELAEAPAGFALRRGRPPRGGRGRQRGDVALGPPAYAVEEPQVGLDVGDHAVRSLSIAARSAGSTSDATRRPSSTCRNPDRMNSSMPRRQYPA